MHICVLVFNFPSRSETFVREHVAGLLKRGHRVTVISSGSGSGIEQAELDELLKLGLHVCESRAYRRKKWMNAIEILFAVFRRPWSALFLCKNFPWTRAEVFQAVYQFECLKRIKPDIVHVHFGTLAGPLHRILKKKNSLLKLIVTWHGYDANQQPKSRGENMYQELFSGGHLHTVGSEFMRQRLCQLGAQPEKLSLVPMGVDLDRFHFIPRNVSPQEILKILSVGRLDEMKGHTHLISAVKALINAGHRIQLRIIGGGPLQADLEKQIINCHLPNGSIQLLGAKNSKEVMAELQQAHLFALTGVEAKSGRVETQGVAFAEAQAIGLPVIGSMVGGVPESLIDGSTGFLCPPRDEAAIAQAIKYFLDNPEKIQEFGKNGRHLVEQKFFLEKMLKKFEQFYDRFYEKN